MVGEGYHTRPDSPPAKRRKRSSAPAATSAAGHADSTPASHTTGTLHPHPAAHLLELEDDAFFGSEYTKVDYSALLSPFRLLALPSLGVENRMFLLLDYFLNAENMSTLLPCTNYYLLCREEHMD